jgi:hypothetical protein
MPHSLAGFAHLLRKESGEPGKGVGKRGSFPAFQNTKTGFRHVIHFRRQLSPFSGLSLVCDRSLGSKSKPEGERYTIGMPDGLFQ